MWRRLIIALVALVILVGGIVGFNLFKEKAIGEYFASMKPPPVTVSVVEAEPVTWKPGFEAIGTALAAQGVSLASETSGIVKEILFNPNDKVEAGQRLVQLDDAVESADLAASQAELELAQTQLERQRTLRERGVTAINDLDVAQASASSSQAQVLKLTAVMNQKSLEAPFAGVIGIAQIDVGEFVPAGTVFATLQDLDNMRVDFSLPEQQITQVKIGMPVAATSEVGDLELRGKIIAIEPKIDQNSRLVTLRAQLDNPGQSLNPGQFIRVWVELPEEQGVMALPQTVVTSNLYGDSVFVVRTEGEGDQAKQTVEQVFVKTGRRSGELVEIREGISAGDEVVSAGQNRLTSGASVKIDNTVNPLPAAAN
ncbi:membrane fusion protein (multidrug efflux system) [Amaricoccus macauensis]|uniref:Membrane fusion protein (Multidrug efflux system) n=1 Tax=Amaricoccus macauensis TaxID=57001 RepID=A0A840SUB5_9RHOB|nr:efflux RND transporter periplasmic adaptor subunit [Amaricoccus macauensis]MBB5224105.1 membrane fusion protein (multidrug efflux system) [Amaricoccus macauensis]